MKDFVDERDFRTVLNKALHKLHRREDEHWNTTKTERERFVPLKTDLELHFDAYIRRSGT